MAKKQVFVCEVKLVGKGGQTFALRVKVFFVYKVFIKLASELQVGVAANIPAISIVGGASH